MNLAYEVMYGYGKDGELETGGLEDIVEHCVYEKGDVLGGTWVVNRYPGVACDVPAHIYTCEFLFAPRLCRLICPSRTILQGTCFGLWRRTNVARKFPSSRIQTGVLSTLGAKRSRSISCVR